jgi:hypothetical protein
VSNEPNIQSVPSFVTKVAGELEPGYWRPQNLHEWNEFAKTSALVGVWVEQQTHERSLRKTIGIWVFWLITLQIIGVFALVVLDAFNIFTVNQLLVQFLIPSVLGEVFGMGFVVVKYLFSAKSTSLTELFKK